MIIQWYYKYVFVNKFELTQDEIDSGHTPLTTGELEHAIENIAQTYALLKYLYFNI